MTFTRLSREDLDVPARCEYFQFPGQGQRLTPVMNDRGIYDLIMDLKSKKAKKIKKKFADLIGRYLRGDQSHYSEIDANNKAFQDSLPESDPLKLAPHPPREAINNPSLLLEQDVAKRRESRAKRILLNLLEYHGMKSIVPSRRTRKPGVYIVVVGCIVRDLLQFDSLDIERVGIHTYPLITYLGKYGETRKSLSDCKERHADKYKEIESDTFIHLDVCVYYKPSLVGLEIESEVGNAVKLLTDSHCGSRFRVSEVKSSAKELFYFSPHFTLFDAATKAMEGIMLEYSSVESVEVVDSSKDLREHEYRIKKIEVEVERAKIEQLRLQLEMKKLERVAAQRSKRRLRLRH